MACLAMISRTDYRRNSMYWMTQFGTDKESVWMVTLNDHMTHAVSIRIRTSSRASKGETACGTMFFSKRPGVRNINE